MERAFKGIWIPKEIWLDDNLNWVEKVLLVEIDSLDNENGCFASNAYFADFFGLSKRRVSESISGLNNKGYITIKLKYKEGTKQVEKRIVKSCYTYSGKLLGGMEESNYTPMEEKCADNNTSFNNISNNTSNKAAAAERDNKQYIVKSLETWQKLWLFPNLVQRDDLDQLIDIYGDDLVDAAIKVAGSKDVPKGRAINFIEACLREWTDASVKTVEEAREYQKKRGNSKPSSYKKQPVRKEALPYWAQDGYVYEEKHMTKKEIEEMRASATRGIERN